MANTTKSTRTTKSTISATNNTVVEKKADVPIRPLPMQEVDTSQFVVVRNGFQGKLVYKSRLGEKYVWDEFGSEQELELRELKNAKSSHKKMFINNWFMFDEPWIIDYLGVRQYYMNTPSIEHFDDIFNQTPAEIKKTVAGMSTGLKKSVAYRAAQLVANGEIDSRKTISALEESLGIELIEK